MIHEAPPLRVLLVDDERMVCAHLRTVLDADSGIHVVGEASDGAEAVEQTVRLEPHVVLMDLRMPGVDGLTAIEQILALPAAPRVLALTMLDADDYVRRALHLGAVGFILKSTAPEELIRLVKVAADGHTVVSTELVAGLVASPGRAPDTDSAARAKLVDLNDRELEVLALLGTGLSNALIARELHLSEPTIKRYVSQLMVKLECDNRTQLGLLAFAFGVASAHRSERHGPS